MEKMQTIIITGLSGAGKTKAAEWFEDNDYYCIDNMPPALIGSFIDLAVKTENHLKKAAFVVDIRGGEFFRDLSDAILYMKGKENIDCKIFFVEASDTTIVKRYNETRRVHPLSNGIASKEVVKMERSLLNDIRAMSDYVIDTTNMKPAEMKLEIGGLILGKNHDRNFSVNIISFGYKNGLPVEYDLIFDMRFIPNPFYIPELKELTGEDKPVYDYVMDQDITIKFVGLFKKMVEELVPGYIREGKYHLNIAFGCTGGQHRSVAMAERAAEIMKEKGYRVNLKHRENH